MYKEYNFNKYCLENSIIHNLNPVVKIISLILIVIGLFFLNGFLEVLLVSIHLLNCILWANISIRLYMKKIYIFRYVLLLLFIFKLLISLNILVSLLLVFKVIAFIIYINIIIFTTTQFQMISGLERVLNPISRFIELNKFIFNFTLLFRFFTIYQEQEERINIALSLKGKQRKKITLKQKIYVIISSIKFSFEKIKILKEVMYVKLYDCFTSRSNYKYNKVTFKDIFVVVINISIIILLLRKR